MTSLLLPLLRPPFPSLPTSFLKQWSGLLFFQHDLFFIPLTIFYCIIALYALYSVFIWYPTIWSSQFNSHIGWNDSCWNSVYLPVTIVFSCGTILVLLPENLFHFIPVDRQRRRLKHWIFPFCSCAVQVCLPVMSPVTPGWALGEHRSAVHLSPLWEQVGSVLGPVCASARQLDFLQYLLDQGSTTQNWLLLSMSMDRSELKETCVPGYYVNLRWERCWY